MSALARAALVCLLVLAGTAAARASTWLVLSDVHFDPANHDARPVRAATDTNLALLDSAIAEMRRVVPDPPVVIIGGDFLSHYFDVKTAAPTMRYIAQRFDRAFPRAQFAITLGNEDSACGDYALAPNGPFLAAVARAWEPLVNRHGAAPDFARTFVHDGFYTATLPLAHTRLVAVDDVFWSPRYRPGCGAPGGAGARSLADLRAALHAQPREQRWVLAHIPPGIDAYSTAHLVHRLVVVPFLAPGPRAAFASALAAPPANVRIVLLGHTHKFGYRLVARPGRDPVPLLLVPSVSPIFGNDPAFLTLDVDTNGTIRSAESHAFLEDGWRDIGGTTTLGMRSFDGAELARLHERLAREPALRATFARLYSSGAPPEIDERNWRTYWCAAQTLAATPFRGCLAEPGVGIVRRRGIVVLAIVAVALIAIVAAIVVVVRRRRRASV